METNGILCNYWLRHLSISINIVIPLDSPQIIGMYRSTSVYQPVTIYNRLVLILKSNMHGHLSTIMCIERKFIKFWTSGLPVTQSRPETCTSNIHIGHIEKQRIFHCKKHECPCCLEIPPKRCWVPAKRLTFRYELPCHSHLCTGTCQWQREF